jgi:putative tricarboxylic transport membrane protein
MRLNDGVFGVILMIAGAAIHGHAHSFPPVPGQTYGSALFPMIIGGVLAACGAILTLKGIRQRRSRPFVVLPEWLKRPRGVISLLLVIASLIFYIAAADALGFGLTSLAILVGLQLWLRVRPLPAVAVAILTTLVLGLGFGKLLRVPLPRGIIEGLF